MKFLLHWLLFLVTFFSFTHLIGMVVNNIPMLPFQRSMSYRSLDCINEINLILFNILQSSLARGQLKFYFAVQHHDFRNFFFIITPEFKDREEVRHIVFKAITDKRLFQAVVCETRFSFITSFETMEALQRRLFHGGKPVL